MKKALQLALLALVVGVPTFPARAATINVASGAVTVSNNGICSLREAINNAEADSNTSADCTAGSGTDTIVLASGTYNLPDQNPTNNFDIGLPEIRSTIIINGNGATIQRDPSLFTGTACGGGGAKFRLFFISDGNLTLNNMTLQNGCASNSDGGAGGGLLNHGTLALNNVTVTGNEADNSGGAIHNDGNLTLTQSTISNNAVLATDAGGGGIVNRGTMNVVQTTISGNNGAGAGGGVDTDSSATFANSTVSGNVSAGDGGGIYNQGTSSISNATIAANHGTQASGPGLGSGIYGATGSVTLTNSLVAQQVNGANCNSGLSGGGNNLDDDGTCPTATVASAQIGPLANNGGPTQTHALLVGSPAINAGNDSVCGASPVNGVDQRGESRTINTCDIGAFEYVMNQIGNMVSAVPALDPKYLVLLVLLLLIGGAKVIRLR